MRKPAFLASDFEMTRCVTRHHPSEDRISLLSDELLISILSLLPLKEAARTSVLSKRWIQVWAYVPVLDFDATTALYRITDSTSGGTQVNFSILLERERHCFVRWMKKVLQSHKALTMDEFRVYCDLGSSYKVEIDKWLQYAFARNVRKLELNLSNYNTRSDFCNIYTFSHKAIGLGSLRSSEINSFTHLQSLKILILKRVHVSEEYLKFFLHNCKFLEQLVVHRSGDLQNLEVQGPDLALQHLELYFCPRLKSLIVHNVNLTSLKVSYLEELVLKDVPTLVDFCFSGYNYVLKDVIGQLSCCLSKLEVLTFRLKVEHYKEKIAEFLPQLTGLKQLTLDVDGSYDEETMIGLTDFIRASPNLEKFVLKIHGIRGYRCSRKLKSEVNYPHHHLKVVELNGCYGSTNEVELVKYFLENAVSLEKIIINPRRQWPLEFGWFLQRPITEEEEDLERYLKEKLEKLFPWQMTKIHIDIYK